MDWVPPKLVRRLLVDPFVVVLALAAIVVSPALFLAAAIVDLLSPGRWASVRFVAVGVSHLAYEAVGIVALFALWVESGFGLRLHEPPMQERHQRFARWWLSRVVGMTERLIGLRVEIEDRQPPRAGPVLVFSRHAGPWDSFLLVHALCRGYDRHARVVMKAAMQWDPVVDVLGNRVACRFIHPHAWDAHRYIHVIGELSHGLGEHEALVLFPEGGNFTEGRRLAGIQRLFQRGDAKHWEEAIRMRHLIAPHPGGVTAAIAGAPEADVVFVAHTGLEDLSTFPDLWRAVPLARPVFGRYWRISPADIPKGKDQQVDWLFAWWSKIDRWIDDCRARMGLEPLARDIPERAPTLGVEIRERG